MISAKGATMTITIIDPDLLAQVRAIEGNCELRDAEGHLVGYIKPPPLAPLPPGVESPFTEEQRAEFRKQRRGRPLKDILRDLEARG